MSSNNNNETPWLGYIILLVGAILGLGIIKWLFTAIFKIALIVVAVVIVLAVLYIIFGQDTGSSKSKQSYYIDEKGHKIYVKKPRDGEEVIVESHVINCPGCNISLSSSIETCPKCGHKIK